MKTTSQILRLARCPAVFLTLGLFATPSNTLRHAAVRPSRLSVAACSATLSREYNMIEPEDVMKWWVVRREMKHYAGEVFAWDVVNEVLNEKGQAKDSIWYNQPGIGLTGKGTA
jgi:GH35 family endo-1,4-beta-xylanase